MAEALNFEKLEISRELKPVRITHRKSFKTSFGFWEKTAFSVTDAGDVVVYGTYLRHFVYPTMVQYSADGQQRTERDLPECEHNELYHLAYLKIDNDDHVAISCNSEECKEIHVCNLKNGKITPAYTDSRKDSPAPGYLNGNGSNFLLSGSSKKGFTNGDLCIFDASKKDEFVFKKKIQVCQPDYITYAEKSNGDKLAIISYFKGLQVLNLETRKTEWTYKHYFGMEEKERDNMMCPTVMCTDGPRLFIPRNYSNSELWVYDLSNYARKQKIALHDINILQDIAWCSGRNQLVFLHSEYDQFKNKDAKYTISFYDVKEL